MFINVTDDHARALIQAVDNGHVGLESLLETYRFMTKSAADNQDHIARARGYYTNDDVEIDDEPCVSRGDEGTWVNAWLWVYDVDVETETSEDDIPPVERIYRHLPATCPSNHWNDGNDYCADCGKNLQE